MADCNDAIPLENVDYCPTDELTPGVSEVGVYVAAVSDFVTIEKPADLKTGLTLEDIATIKAAHVFKAGRGFHKVQLSPDSGKVESTNVGEKGFLNLENSFTGMVQGTGPKVAGWVRKYKNIPLIVVVKEKSGNIKQIGSDLSGAYVSEINATSGAAAGDKKGTTVKIAAIQGYMAPEYAAAIEEFVPPAPAAA